MSPPTASGSRRFFEKTDWAHVDANVERLPYLARQLERHTPAAKAKPAADSELFTFAQRPDWKEQLDRDILAQIDALLRDYAACLSRIRACRAPIRAKRRKNDIERILFARGQEDAWDTDELYAHLEALPPECVAESLEALRQEGWQFLTPEERERFLLTWLPELEPLFDLFSDFRCGGYRILGDLLCDIHEENTAQERKQLVRPGDSPAFATMMEDCQREPRRYREVAASRCRALLEEIVQPVTAVRYVAALGGRSLLWELLLDALEPNVLEAPYAE